jgi:hypothetical protein
MSGGKARDALSPQLEPVDLSKPVPVPVLIAPKDELAANQSSFTPLLDCSSRKALDCKDSPATSMSTEVATAADIHREDGGSPMEEVDQYSSEDEEPGVDKKASLVNGTAEENRQSMTTTVTVDAEETVTAAATDLVLDSNLSLESLLEQAEGKMLTLLATEGPDGTFVILTEPTAASTVTTITNTTSTSAAAIVSEVGVPAGMEGRDTGGDEPSLVEQLEAELRSLKKNLNDSLAKITADAAAAAETEAAPAPEVEPRNGPDETPPDLDIMVSDPDTNTSDSVAIADSLDSSPVRKPARSPDSRTDFMAVLEETGDESPRKDTEELVKNTSISPDVIEDSLASLEDQVGDLVDFIDDPLIQFIKEEKRPTNVAAKLRSPRRKRKRSRNSSCSDAASQAEKAARLEVLPPTEDLSETIEIEAQLVQLSAGSADNDDAVSSEEDFPVLRRKSWRSCRDEFLPQRGKSIEVDEEEEEKEKEGDSNRRKGKRCSARRSLRLISAAEVSTASDDETGVKIKMEREDLPVLRIEDDLKDEMESDPLDGAPSDDAPGPAASPRRLKNSRRGKESAALLMARARENVKSSNRRGGRAATAAKALTARRERWSTSPISAEKIKNEPASKRTRDSTIPSEDDGEERLGGRSRMKNALLEECPSTPEGGRVKRAAARRAEQTFAAILPDEKEAGEEDDITDQVSEYSNDCFEPAKEMDLGRFCRMVKRSGGVR